MYLCKCCNDCQLVARPNGVYYALYCKTTGRFQKYASPSEIEQYKVKKEPKKKYEPIIINDNDLTLILQQYNVEYMGDNIYFNHDLMVTYKLL